MSAKEELEAMTAKLKGIKIPRGTGSTNNSPTQAAARLAKIKAEAAIPRKNPK
jgi:hypothetical protein